MGVQIKIRKKIIDLYVGMENNVEILPKENVIFTILNMTISKSILQDKIKQVDRQWILILLEILILRIASMVRNVTKWIVDVHSNIQVKIFQNILKKKRSHISLIEIKDNRDKNPANSIWIVKIQIVQKTTKLQVECLQPSMQLTKISPRLR